MLTIVKRRRNSSKDTTPDEEKMKVGKLFIVVRPLYLIWEISFPEADCAGADMNELC